MKSICYVDVHLLNLSDEADCISCVAFNSTVVNKLGANFNSEPIENQIFRDEFYCLQHSCISGYLAI
jgi:hypothetical protein